jgi:hypothetical protein
MRLLLVLTDPDLNAKNRRGVSNWQMILPRCPPWPRVSFPRVMKRCRYHGARHRLFCSACLLPAMLAMPAELHTTHAATPTPTTTPTFSSRPSDFPSNHTGRECQCRPCSLPAQPGDRAKGFTRGWPRKKSQVPSLQEPSPKSFDTERSLVADKDGRPLAQRQAFALAAGHGEPGRDHPCSQADLGIAVATGARPSSPPRPMGALSRVASSVAITVPPKHRVCGQWQVQVQVQVVVWCGLSVRYSGSLALALAVSRNPQGVS